MSNDFWSSMPRDPFEDDPVDPSFLLEPEEPMEPLTDQERTEVREDLGLVQRFRQVMGPAGFEGVCRMCEDCDEMHYYPWDVLEAHYRSLLNDELSAVHEPAFDPNVDAYAPWEYCVGFIEGMEYQRSIVFRRGRRFR